MKIRTLLLSAVLTTAFAIPAEAKEVRAVKVCGPDACEAAAGGHPGLMVFLRGGAPTVAPERGSDWYRVRVRVGGGGHSESFGLIASPEARLTRWSDQELDNWVRMTAAEAAAYRRTVAELAPYPAAKLPGVEPAEASADPEQAAAGAADVSTSGGDGDSPIWILAAGASLIAIAVTLAWRRRRRDVHP